MQEYLKSDLIGQLGELHSILFVPEHNEYFTLIQENKEEFEILLHQAVLHCDKLGESFLCNHDENPKELIITWRGIFSNNIDNSNEKKSEIEAVFRRTQKFLRSLLTIPNKKKAIRRYSSKSLSEVMERTANEKAKISEQLVKEKKKISPDEDTIQNLEKLKEVSDKELEELYKERNRQELEEVSEKDWAEKIKNTFQLLRECTSVLEDEHKNVDTEYHLFLYGLILPSLVLLIWLCKLYGFMISRQPPYSNWVEFLPYYLPVPIFVALFWVMIVQKNRAGKISIALSERLYQIKYLEGLLMTINQLSQNSQDAIETISRCLDKMVNGYLTKVAKEPMDELHVEAIEKKEINENSYFKIIDKLTDLIKK